MISTRSIILFVSTFLLFACEEKSSVSGSNPLDKAATQWQTLPDGSHFTKTSFSTDMMTSEAATRCWPKQKAGFVCVEVARSNAASLRITRVLRKEESELRKTILPAISASEGYSCVQALEPSEEINRQGDTLISNPLGYGRRRWSARYVNDYIRKNAVGGPNHFKCVEILSAVLSGSLATVSTTSLDRSMVE